MIKKFYRNRASAKVFFKRDMKLRVYAYGDSVHDDLVRWRRDFLLRWNKPTSNFLVFEGADTGANLAKLDEAAQIMVDTTTDYYVCERKKYGLHPLWIEDMLLEVDDGFVVINGQKTSFNLGMELKGWAISVLWKDKIPTYSLFVIGKPHMSGDMMLSVYPISKDGISPIPRISMPMPHTPARRSKIFCFGRHIFIIHDARLEYLYYTPDEGMLEVVGIESDDYNSDKECCNSVPISSDVVINSRGRVFWISGNLIYSFPIGYPQRVVAISPPKNTEAVKIQCYGEYLFVYSRSEITGGVACTKYVIGENAEIESELFNTGSHNNIFFSERGGALYYIKECSDSQKTFVARHIRGDEEIIEQLRIKFADKLFCFDGKMYSGARYVGYDSDKKLIVVK